MFLPLQTIQYNSDSAIDFLIVGDGFLQSEQALFESKADEFINHLWTLSPFDSLRNSFNVYRLGTISNESGGFTVTHPNNPVTPTFVDNFLGSHLNANGLPRLTGFTKKRFLEQYIKTRFDNKVFVILISNIGNYGGSGQFDPNDEEIYVTAQSTIDTQYNAFKDLVVHELGHSYGELADEYGGNCTYVNFDDPKQYKLYNKGNVTDDIVNDRKWDYLANPEYIEGANYCDTGWWRSSQSSLMRGFFEPNTMVDQQFNQVSIDLLNQRTADLVSYNSNAVTYRGYNNNIYTIDNATNLRVYGKVRIKRSMDINSIYVARGAELICEPCAKVSTQKFINKGKVKRRYNIKIN